MHNFKFIEWTGWIVSETFVVFFVTEWTTYTPSQVVGENEERKGWKAPTAVSDA